MMPTVPELVFSQSEQERKNRPTPEHLLMTAADMHARGQLTQNPSTFGAPGANLKLPFPGGGRGPRPTSKRR
jgi:hypothetical protein